MLDAHCHLDLYPDQSQTARNAESAGVFVVCVTNLPSAFLAAQPHIRRFKKVRLASGLHPLNAELHTDAELVHFKKLVNQTSFIGEIRTRFFAQGYATRDRQLSSFRYVVQSLETNQNLLRSIHDELRRRFWNCYNRNTATRLFFIGIPGRSRLWGPQSDGVISFLSIPQWSAVTKRGNTIATIPRDRVLTESDGPFIDMGKRRIEPGDVCAVEEALGKMWGLESDAVRAAVALNFQALIKPVKEASSGQ